MEEIELAKKLINVLCLEDEKNIKVVLDFSQGRLNRALFIRPGEDLYSDIEDYSSSLDNACKNS